MSRQRGVALVMVLLMFAVLAMMAARIVSQLSNDVGLAQTLFDKTQARWYALAGEQYAVIALSKQWQQEAKARVLKDTLGQSWAKDRRYPVDNGEIRVHIEDAQGRFDVNRLAASSPAARLSGVRVWLQAAGVSVDKAQAVMDWMARYPVENRHEAARQPRQGHEVSPSGATGAPPQHGVHVFTDVSQLRTVKGLTEADYQKLRAVSVVLNGAIPLNVNTASVAVLRMLGQGLSVERARQLVAARHGLGFADVNAFLAQPVLAGQRVNAGALSVNSQYFLVTSRGRVDGLEALLTALLYRDKQGVVRVLWHRYGMVW